MKKSLTKAFMLALLGAVCISAVSVSAEADTLLTSSASINSPTVIDFSAFGPGYTFGSGPVGLGSGVTWSTNVGGSVIGNGNYVLLSGTLSNGTWDSNIHDVGLDADPGTMTFTLSTPVSAIGAFMNYAPCAVCSDVTINAFDAMGNSLGSFDINTLAPISTPGGVDRGAFRGISAGSPEIASFTVSNAYVILSDLTFGGVAPVPESSSLFMLGTGLLGLVAFAARSKHIMPIETAEAQKAQNQVTSLINFSDELRRKAPIGK